MLSPKQWQAILEIPMALQRIATALEYIAHALKAQSEMVSTSTTTKAGR